MRTLPTLLALALLLGGWLPLPGAEASEADAKKAYYEKTRAARRSADPGAWLRIGPWIDARTDISDKSRRHWRTYIHHQYGVAAHKQIADNDVDGWLRLARTMERLLGSRSVAKSYLAKGLAKNPDDARLLAALGRDAGGRRQATGVLWTSKKTAAERAGTAAAFHALVAWCDRQTPFDATTHDRRTYALARALYVGDGAGSAADPIVIAWTEGERALAAPPRKPDEPRVVVPSLLEKRESRGMTSKEIGARDTYRLEPAHGPARYADKLPTANTYLRVWKRGTRTRITPWSDTAVMLEDVPAWWLMQWDADAGAWVVHTRADERAAATRRVTYAEDRLRRAKADLARTTKLLERQPKDRRAQREAAERLARKGGKVREFRRLLQGLVQRARSIHHERATRIQRENAVTLWTAKVAELRQVAARAR